MRVGGFAKRSQAIHNSHIDSFVLLAAQVPARIVAPVRKKRVDAGLVLRIAREEFGFTILLRDGIQRLDCQRPVRIPIGCDPEAK